MLSFYKRHRLVIDISVLMLATISFLLVTEAMI